MLPVEILPVQETIVLRARGSELLILPHHVKKLKGLSKPRDFSQYFVGEALVNRPARKLFEAWLRKDHTLWPRLYQTVHKEMEVSAEEGGEESTAPTQSAKPVPAAKVAAPVRASDDDDEQEDKEDEKPVKKAKAASKDDDKPAKKPAAKDAKPAKEKETKAAKAKPASKEKDKEPKKAAKSASKDKDKAKPAAKAKTAAKKKG